MATISRFECPHCGCSIMANRTAGDVQCRRCGRWSHASSVRQMPLIERDKASDEKTTAERAWRAPLKPPAPQQPCDAGLFSDDHLQKDLF